MTESGQNLIQAALNLNAIYTLLAPSVQNAIVYQLLNDQTAKQDFHQKMQTINARIPILKQFLSAAVAGDNQPMEVFDKLIIAKNQVDASAQAMFKGFETSGQSVMATVKEFEAQVATTKEAYNVLARTILYLMQKTTANPDGAAVASAVGCGVCGTQIHVDMLLAVIEPLAYVLGHQDAKDNFYQIVQGCAHISETLVILLQLDRPENQRARELSQNFVAGREAMTQAAEALFLLYENNQTITAAEVAAYQSAVQEFAAAFEPLVHLYCEPITV